MEDEIFDTNDSLDSMNLLMNLFDGIEENEESLYCEEEEDDEGYFSQDDSWYDEEDYSDDGCGEGYSCYNCPNFGCPSNPYN